MNNIEEYNKIQKQWIVFQKENKKVRIRDAANTLKISEASLLSTEIDEKTYFLHINNFEDFFNKILNIDRLMFLIRSDISVHEKVFNGADLQFKKNKFISKEDSDLILKFNKQLFKHSFFQKKKHGNRELRSFQIFDEIGNAIFKIYLKGKDKSLFDQIALEYKTEYQYELQKESDKGEMMRNVGANFLGTIDFYFIPKNNAFEINDKKLNKNSLRNILIKASDSKLPIQIHGLGLGCTQYHYGLVKNIVDYGPWLNVIDKKFNLHILEKNLVKSSLYTYEVNKSQYYSVEFFDDQCNHILGVTSIKGFEKEFEGLIRNIKEIK